MIDLPDTENSPVLRTDYSDDFAWERICEAVRAPADEFRAYVPFLSDPKYQGLSAAQVAEFLPADFSQSFIFIVDDTTVHHPDHPVLVLDLNEDRGRTFRVIPAEVWSVWNNLSIANMDFSEFADNAQADGIFRGFSGAAG